MREQREACKVIQKHFEGKIVGAEIGVFYGGHAESLLFHLPNLHLHLVDDASENIDLKNRLGEELKEISPDRYTWHKKTSLEASKEVEDNSLDFVYIDANHHFEAVFQDCKVWYPKIKEGGIICGHDYNTNSTEDNVKGAVDEFFTGKQVNFSGRDWWVFK